MKCPRCQRDIDDRASFCGFCGMVIAPPPQAPQAGPAPAEGKQQAAQARAEAKRIREEEKKNRREAKKSRRAAAPQAAPPQTVPPNAAPPQEAPPKKKKHTGVIVLLVLSVLAVAAGGALGFLFTREIIDLRQLLPSRGFAWSDHAEGATAQVATPEPEDEYEPEDKLESQEPEETQDPEPLESQPDPDAPDPDGPDPDAPDPDDPDPDDPDSDDPDPDGPDSDNPDPDDPGSDDPDENESPGQPEGPEDPHYLKYTGNTLLIVDDAARVLSEDSMWEIIGKARQLSARSGYSIITVFTNDLSGMSVEDFARGYAGDALESDQEDNHPFSTDGFIFVADLDNGAFHLSAFGAAGDQLTDDQIDAILEDVGPYTEASDLKTAVLDIFEQIP